MVHRLLVLLSLIGLLPLAASMAAGVGLGVLRGLPTLQIVGVAMAAVALPVVGIWALCGQKLWGLVLGLWSWPMVLLFAFPGYFPGELGDALATGFSVFASPAGADAARSASEQGLQLAEATPQMLGTAPLPQAQPVEAVCPPAMVLTEDQVALPYEGQGHSMIIPVQFGEQEFPMLFDTGASFTTLSTRALGKLGISVPRNAPVVKLNTANGERNAQLVMVDKVWVGGLLVEGVTIAVCEECADERTRGLLGLNVSGQFLVTMDTAGKQVLFQPRDGTQERVIDVGPWLKTEATVTLFADGRGEAEASAENNGARVVRGVEVGIHCGDTHLAVPVGDVPPGERVSTKVRMPRDAACKGYRVTLDHARW